MKVQVFEIKRLNYLRIEAVAFGANAKGLHSPDERLEVISVERTWNFLIQLLKKLY